MPTRTRAAAVGGCGAVASAVGIGACIPGGATSILGGRGRPAVWLGLRLAGCGLPLRSSAPWPLRSGKPQPALARGLLLMAATSIITCPKCTKKFKGREELIGRKVRCPSCGHGFIVQDL